MRRLLVLSTALLAVLGARGAQGQLYQAPYGPGGTWNIYELVSDVPATWMDAHEDAKSRVQQSTTGHLVDVLSGEENGWLFGIFGAPTGINDLWIGLTDREGAAPGAQESQTFGVNQGTQGWAWTSGKPFTYNAWGGGEPNNWDPALGAAGTPTTGGEDVAHIRNDGLWNDHSSGYFEDEPAVPTLQPGTSLDETANDPSYAYIVEYPTQRATQWPGIEYPLPSTAWPTGAALPGINGAAGTMGVTDYRGTFTADGGANVVALLQQIVDNEIDYEVYTAQLPKADATDPQTNAGGGPLGGTPIPFPSDTPADDDDIITVGRATIQVPETGTYTFKVQSDDGFGFRILNQKFKAEYGNGQLDPVDGSLWHPANTGDSNTRGVIDLAAGKHDVEFLFWERGGGAFWEITSAQSDVGASGSGRWLALGDASVLAPTTVGPVAKLAGPLKVGSLLAVTDTSVEVAREELLDASPGDFDYDSNSITKFVIDDHNIGTPGCPFGDIPAFHTAPFALWPANDPAVGGTNTDYNNWGNLITGQFTINDGDAVAGEDLTVTFHVDVDDRSIVRVVGQDFTGVAPGNGAAGLLELEGDEAMFSDAGVCNANYNGVITLKEGVTYDLEVTHVDNGGDAGMQVLVGLGDFVNNSFDVTAFFPLTTTTSTVFYPGNKGLAFVDKTAGIKGDHNNNGSLDAGDLDLQAAQMVLNPVPPPAGYDLNADNAVNYNDRLVWLHDLRKTWVGDSNLDGLFTSADFVLAFQAGKYEVPAATATWVQGDWNGDQLFTSADFVAAFADGGYEAGPRPGAVSAVPEPSSLVLVLLGMAGLLGVARRRG